MNFVLKPFFFIKMMKFMCKNELFQNLKMKNELFKVQRRKANFI